MAFIEYSVYEYDDDEETGQQGPAGEPFEVPDADDDD